MSKSKQITLALDSTGPTLLAAVSDGEKKFTLRHSGIKQERFLLPLIERALAKLQADLTDVKKVFVVRGPGRFTGIRISLTFASMLRELNGTNVAGATLFDILRRQAEESHAFLRWKKEHDDGVLAVVLHAFREEYFLQIFDGHQEPPKWMNRDELLQKISDCQVPLYAVGTDKDGASLAVLLPSDCRLAPLADCRVRGQTLLEMAQNPIYEKDALEPLYLKPARFELNK